MTGTAIIAAIAPRAPGIATGTIIGPATVTSTVITGAIAGDIRPMARAMPSRTVINRACGRTICATATASDRTAPDTTAVTERTRSMFSKFTTTLMAGAFALASVAAPTEVRAGNDTGKIVAGLAVGAIIGAAIASQSKKRRHNDGYVSRQHHDAYGRGYHRGHQRGHHRGHQRGYQRHDGYGHHRVNLPNACRVHKGHRSGYSGRCLGGYNYSHARL